MLLYQSPAGYRYNSDSIFLYDFVATHSLQGELLDVGCGVGILSLLAARDFPVRVTAIDKQRSMAEYARHNYKIHGISARVEEGDFGERTWENRFDFVLSNPPFYPDGATRSRDPVINTARYACHLPLERLTRGVARSLKARGYFLFCYDASQVDRVLESLRRYGLNPERLRFVHPKADRAAKIVLVSARKGSRSPTRVLPPLIVFDGGGRYTPEAEEAFRRADTHSIKAERIMERSGNGS